MLEIVKLLNETLLQEKHQELKKLQCDFIQGYKKSKEVQAHFLKIVSYET